MTEGGEDGVGTFAIDVSTLLSSALFQSTSAWLSRRGQEHRNSIRFPEAE